MVGEIATRHLCVVLNKIDLLPEDVRPRLISKAKKRLAQTLAATTFAGCPMVPCSAKPGGIHQFRHFLTPTQGIELHEVVVISGKPLHMPNSDLVEPSGCWGGRMGKFRRRLNFRGSMRHLAQQSEVKQAS